MFQFHMSIAKNNADWYYNIEKILTIKLKGYDGIIASKMNEKRLDISIAAESVHKAEIVSVLKESISDMYLTVCKFEYLQKRLSLPFLNKDSLVILLHTLVAFDRECESSIIEEHLTITSSMALDGFFNFRLEPLRSRWDEIILLAMNNSSRLSNDDTLNELVKFLMSAVAPKIQKLDISYFEGEFSVKGKYKNSSFEYRILSSEQLIFYLINIAPIELNIYGGLADEKLYKRLVNIFDVKSVRK